MEKRIIELKNKYKSKIYLIDDKKIIYKLDCTCRDFIYRKIKSGGLFADKKYYEEPCKHLKPIVNALIKQGYTLKKPKMEGSERLTAEVRRQVNDRSNGICEFPQCSNMGQTYHRKVRGSNGGKYITSNVVHLCNYHHKLIHGNEFQGAKGK